MILNGVRVKISVCYRYTILREGNDAAVSEQHQREFQDWSRFADWVRLQNQQGLGVVMECWGLEIV